jgi:glycerol-3-phosphate O-acyltransferase
MKVSMLTIVYTIALSLSSSSLMTTMAWVPSVISTRTSISRIPLVSPPAAAGTTTVPLAVVSSSKLYVAAQSNDQLLTDVANVAVVNGVASENDLPELAGDYKIAFEQAMVKIGSKIPEPYKNKMEPLLGHFLKEYMIAAQVSHTENPTDTFTEPYVTVERFVKGATYAVQYGVPASPDFYTFDVSHTALQGDQVGYGRTDFYSYGNNFFRHCMDFATTNTLATHVLGADNLQQALQQSQAGDNVVFFANHQSEADPQVVSLCFEKAGPEYANAAAQMLYVAGHKVTTDVLAIPFSMGRNLICIHSKKHIDADKETKPRKQKQNLKAMNGLLRKLKEGGTMVWVAPSGGRDRRDPITGQVPVAQFDSKTIDMFRLMGNKSGKPTHYYTMAMVSYDLCPPPDTVEAGTGEKRNVRYSPVGIKIGTELVSVGGLESRQEFCNTAMKQCENDYAQVQASLAEYLQAKKK